MECCAFSLTLYWFPFQTPLTDEWCAYADSMKGELVVGGVFLRLFILTPAWTLSQPTKFATELL